LFDFLRKIEYFITIIFLSEVNRQNMSSSTPKHLAVAIEAQKCAEQMEIMTSKRTWEPGAMMAQARLMVGLSRQAVNELVIQIINTPIPVPETPVIPPTPTPATPASTGADLMDLLPISPEGFPFVMSSQDPECSLFLANCHRRNIEVRQFILAGKTFVTKSVVGHSCPDLWITVLTLDELYARPTLGAEHAYKVALAIVMGSDQDFASREITRILQDAEIIPAPKVQHLTAVQRGLYP
jgi:hypothetical protein